MIIARTLLGVGLNNTDNGISLIVLPSNQVGPQAKHLFGGVQLAGIDSSSNVKLLRLNSTGGLIS